MGYGDGEKYYKSFREVTISIGTQVVMCNVSSVFQPASDFHVGDVYKVTGFGHDNYIEITRDDETKRSLYIDFMDETDMYVYGIKGVTYINSVNNGWSIFEG